MKILKDLLYSESHEWVKFTSDTIALVGLTDFALEALGGIVFINLPEVGSEVTAGESFGDVESIKAVSDLYSPVTGRIKAVNEALSDAPDTINDDPYGAWFIEIEDITAKGALLSPDEYESHCAKED